MNKLKGNLYFTLFFALLLSAPAFSQVDIAGRNNSRFSATPRDMWEVGLNSGTFLTVGDMNAEFGFGAGIHVRKALDYVFSLRGDAQTGILKGSHQEGTHRTNFKAGSIQMLMSVNNLVWNTDAKRNFNLYLLIGAGMNTFSTEVDGPNLQSADDSWISQLEAGGGLAFRITDRFNIGLESKLYFLLGGSIKSDLVDGLARFDNDIPTYTSVRLNYNIGDKDEKSEPLYWVNPMDVVLAEITELKKRPVVDLTDSDDDGVIDMLDKEPDTYPGAPVDTRGITLDSDKDGIPDYKDKEPYSPPGFEVDEKGIAINTNQNESEIDKNELRKMIEEVLKEFDLEENSSQNSAAMTDWLLPMIHFDIDSEEIRDADFKHLSSVATVLHSIENLRIVVKGYTDKTASNTYNKLLSYNRAKAVTDYLVNTHKVRRNQLILQYGGEDDTLVPDNGNSFMNRRVEFRIAEKGDTEMGRPNPDKKGRF